MAVNTAVKESIVKTSQKIASYPIVDTGQRKSYSNNAVIPLPDNANDFYGQDASYSTNPPSYTDNNNGTITDNVTGLIWQKQMGDKLSYDEALLKINTLKLAGYGDWRIPTIKELYSLIQFTGSVKKGEKALTLSSTPVSSINLLVILKLKNKRLMPKHGRVPSMSAKQ
ncbi:DUF1566 domain-containing protein [Vibrio sp. 10N.261.54.E10]|uniref:Lcl C-terminal domain-containing protein n=1 Tax=Vibrio sp. 10N.261.54.E10 TaxID=1884475 RepID=UPI0039A419F2